jgi:methyl-accepting chemotaxis protein
LVALLIVCLLGMGSAVLKQLTLIDLELRQISDNALPSLDIVNDLSQAQLDQNALMFRHIVTQDDSTMQAIIADATASQKTSLKRLDDYKSLVSDPEDQQLYDRARSTNAQFVSMSNEVFSLSSAGKDTEALQLATGTGEQIEETYKNALQDWKKANDEYVTTSQANAHETDEYVRNLITYGGLAAIALLSLATAFIGFIIFRKVSQPIASLCATLNHVNKKLDFTARAKKFSDDEIGQAIDSTNALLSTVQICLRQLSEGADRVALSSEQMAETSHSMSLSAHQQSQATSNIAATIEQMTVSLAEVAAQTQDTNHQATQSGVLAEQGEQAIVETVRRIDEINAAVKSAAERITALREHSDEISSIVSVIRAVAEQTNLLALNAAIEAARAGEQGRGFAVVADEVRTLAGKTAQSTRDISTTIAHIQQQSQDAAAQMLIAVDKVTAGVDQADASSHSISKIRERSGKSVSMVDQITHAIKEQSAGAHDIATRVQEIAVSIEVNSESAEQSSSSAKQLDELAISMQKEIARFKLH